MREGNAQRKIARRRRRPFGIAHVRYKLFRRLVAFILLSYYGGNSRRGRARSQDARFRNFVGRDTEAPGNPRRRRQAKERRVMQQEARF